jgi:hypothetical protein
MKRLTSGKLKTHHIHSAVSKINELTHYVLSHIQILTCLPVTCVISSFSLGLVISCVKKNVVC